MMVKHVPAEPLTRRVSVSLAHALDDSTLPEDHEDAAVDSGLHIVAAMLESSPAPPSPPTPPSDIAELLESWRLRTRHRRTATRRPRPHPYAHHGRHAAAAAAGKPGASAAHAAACTCSGSCNCPAASQPQKRAGQFSSPSRTGRTGGGGSAHGGSLQQSPTASVGSASSGARTSSRKSGAAGGSSGTSGCAWSATEDCVLAHIFTAVRPHMQREEVGRILPRRSWREAVSRFRTLCLASATGARGQDSRVAPRRAAILKKARSGSGAAVAGAGGAASASGAAAVAAAASGSDNVSSGSGSKRRGQELKPSSEIRKMAVPFR